MATIGADDFSGEFAGVDRERRKQEVIAELLESSGRNSVLLAGNGPVPVPPPEPASEPEAQSEGTLGGVVSAIGEGIKAAPRQVAAGLVETPGAIISGVLEVGTDIAIGLVDASVGIRDWFAKHGIASERSEEKNVQLADMRSKLESLAVNDERSIIGNVVHDITNFMGFFVPFTGGLKGARLIQGLSKASPFAARVAVNAVAGGAAEFAMTDTAQESFLDLFRENPEITDHGLAFMNAGEEDVPRLQRRLENALVGAGLGVVTDGFIEVARLMRSANIARRTAREAARRKAAKAVVSDDAGKTVAGDALPGVLKLKIEEKQVRIGKLGPEDPLVTRSTLGARRVAASSKELKEKFPDLTPEQLRAKAEELRVEAVGEEGIEINISRIDSEDDVKQLIQDVTDLFPGSVERARRGVQSNVKTSAKAKRLNVGLAEVLDTKIGTGLNAEQSVAYRRVWVSMAEKVEELAKVAANKNTASDLDMFKYRKALAAFSAVNNVMLGARAEAGRALQSWRITVGGAAERAQQLTTLLDAGGGDRISRKMAEVYLKGIRAGMTPAQINKMVGVMAIPRGQRIVNAIQESYVLGLLWTPKTHAANLLTNAIFPMIVTGERAAAAQFSRLAGRSAQNSVQVGEAMARVKGLSAGVRSALHLTALADDVTRGQFEATAAATASKLDGARVGISSQAAGINIADAQGLQYGLGKAIDYFGAFTRFPGKILGGADDAFKVVNFAMEREALALRQAAGEAAQKGWDEKRTMERVAELINDPPESIRLAAGNAATYATFQSDPGPITRWLMNGRNAIPGLFVVLPFLKTPGALLNRSFERTPFAPLVGSWRADIAAGGARRDIALAQMSTGSAVTLMFADWAFEDRINAAFPRELGRRRAQQRVKDQPDSLKVGDFTLQLNRIDPFGMQLSLMGNATQLIEEFMLDAEDLPQLSDIFAAITVSAIQSTTSKSWLNGVAQITAAMQNPERKSQDWWQRTAKNLLIPASSLSRTVETLFDPTISDVNSVYDSIASQIVWLSSTLPRRRNLWGEPIRINRINLITPIAVEHRVSNPVDEAILAERGDVRDIGKSTDFGGVPVNFRHFPRVYETYVTLSGNELKIGGKGAKDFLNGLVQSSRYLRKSKGPDGERIKLIRERIGRYRARAQREILRDPQRKYQSEEFNRFREFVDEQKDKARQLRRPLRLEDQ